MHPINLHIKHQLIDTQVYGYFHREVFTCWFLVAIFWPFFYGPEFVRANGKAIALWTGCCALMSIFTLLPVIMVESITQMYVQGSKPRCSCARPGISRKMLTELDCLEASSWAFWGSCTCSGLKVLPSPCFRGMLWAYR